MNVFWLQRPWIDDNPYNTVINQQKKRFWWTHIFIGIYLWACCEIPVPSPQFIELQVQRGRWLVSGRFQFDSLPAWSLSEVSLLPTCQPSVPSSQRPFHLPLWFTFTLSHKSLYEWATDCCVQSLLCLETAKEKWMKLLLVFFFFILKEIQVY